MVRMDVRLVVRGGRSRSLRLAVDGGTGRRRGLAGELELNE